MPEPLPQRSPPSKQEQHRRRTPQHRLQQQTPCTLPIEEGLLQIGLEFRRSDCVAWSQNQAGPALVAGSSREFHGQMEVVSGGVGDHVGNDRQLAFLSRRGFVQPLHRDRHGGVVASEGANEGALEIGSQVVVLDRWIGQPIPESQRQEKHSREGQQYQRNQPGKPSRKLHRPHAFLLPGASAWVKKSCSSLWAFFCFWASAWSRIFSTESGNKCFPSAPARAVAWNRFSRA